MIGADSLTMPDRKLLVDARGSVLTCALLEIQIFKMPTYLYYLLTVNCVGLHLVFTTSSPFYIPRFLKCIRPKRLGPVCAKTCVHKS